jgi:hypothetical protein
MLSQARLPELAWRAIEVLLRQNVVQILLHIFA